MEHMGEQTKGLRKKKNKAIDHGQPNDSQQRHIKDALQRQPNVNSHNTQTYDDGDDDDDEKGQ